MVIIDYNGTGKWSCEAVRERYAGYARRFKVRVPVSLIPLEHQHGTTCWIYPIMQEVIRAIEDNDAAAIEIGIEFIEEDQEFSFGKILKSNTARALRRSNLTPYNEDRIRRRVIQMLLDGMVPHEYHEYAKLLRKIGVGTHWHEVEAKIDRSNRYVMRYYDYIVRHVLPSTDLAAS